MEMIGKKIFKKEMTNQDQINTYIEMSNWCQENDATIKDEGEYYIIVENSSLSDDEIYAENIKIQIDFLRARLDELSYVSEEIALGLAVKEDYTEEIEEIAFLHNRMSILQEY